jgi:hypothetical protein
MLMRVCGRVRESSRRSSVPPIDLVHANGFVEALRDELAAVGEREAFARAETAHVVRDEDLAAFRPGSDAGGEDDGGAE